MAFFHKDKANRINQISPFSLLPNGCVEHIISYTSPGDACRTAAVSSELKSAAGSDVVWEKFLPPDYRDVIARSVSPVAFSTKKELYLSLCDSPLLIDGSKLSFWLSKANGKKCYMLCARELSIVWGSDTRYWKWTSLPESRFTDVAELLRVCWLEIRGKLKAQMLSPDTNYAAYLVFKISESHHGLHSITKVSVKKLDELTNEIEEDTKTAYIVVPENTFYQRRHAPISADRVPTSRSDGWMEIELGEFLICEGDTYDIQMNFLEIEIGNWKEGLIVEGIEVRPKEDE